MAIFLFVCLFIFIFFKFQYSSRQLELYLVEERLNLWMARSQSVMKVAQSGGVVPPHT